MYGEDASGRMVSLLNRGPSATTSEPTITKLPHVSIPSRSSINLPPIDSARRYSAPRYRRQRSVSPKSPSRTPPLVRHNSISSQSDQTVSPMTPSYTNDHLDLQNKAMPYFGPSRYHAQTYQSMAHPPHSFAPSSYLPSIDMSTGDTGNGMSALNQQALQNLQPPLTYPDREPSMVARSCATDLQPAQYIHSNSNTSIASIAPSQKQNHEKPASQSAGTQTSSASSPTISASTIAPKKKFPCPHAARFSCSDTFTTSGHASRHGKKHTGEKSVSCPTCNKAFTRKDNMKQHERTHRNANAKGGHSSSAATTSPSTTTSSLSEAVFASGSRSKGRARSGSDRNEEEDGEGESPGLDALAVAAHMQ